MDKNEATSPKSQPDSEEVSLRMFSEHGIDVVVYSLPKYQYRAWLQ